MIRFKEFMHATNTDGMEEEKRDVQKTLSKLPPSHAALIKGFKWKFQGGNTLHGDTEHVGYMDDQEKEIAVAAPWNYGREFTVLHEVAHRVWELIPNQLKKQWQHIVTNIDKTDESLNQDPEELFCMFYANAYVQNKVIKFSDKNAIQFILKLPS